LSAGRQRVVILGGGMAGLAAAWELSRTEHRDQIESITVYERRPHLGGKGASTRGVSGRIEEHGLHVWLGYYDNAFRLVREVYEEIDRPATDPGCPIATWQDAFRPADVIGAASRDASRPVWTARFGRNDRLPGEPRAGSRPPAPADLLARAVGLLADLLASLDRPSTARPRPELFLSARADPAPPSGRDPVAALRSTIRKVELGAMAAALQGLSALEQVGRGDGSLRNGLLAQLDGISRELTRRLRHDVDGARLLDVVDLVATILRGAVADRLLAGPDRLTTIDGIDFRAWLLRHGARPETTWSPLVNAMYDFVFAYEDGDPERPAFAAGLGLFLAAKLFLEYDGAIFWKMNAGMGDVIFVPLYQALRARRVRFAFGHHVQHLGLARDRQHLDEVVVTRPAGTDGWSPALIDVHGLPCFPTPPAAEHDAEEVVTLRRGADFDRLILALPLGAVPAVAGDLVAAAPAWGAMTTRVRTVGTRSFQAWLTRPEGDLAVGHDGATVSGWARPFDTYSSMGHLLPMEDWPPERPPRGLAYFCSAVPAEDRATTRDSAHQLLTERVVELWPEAVDEDGFRWDVLHGGFDAQHFATNTDPAEHYVQSLPGTGRFRLRADESGWEELVLAGDWINSGLNAGCIEAATISGIEAANVVLGRPLTHAVTGSLYGLDDRVGGG
jgi:uncharacterized protein with NAD-binding domain and iron-sulfur cluster